MNKLDAFIKLATLFSEHGYHLYLVGGSVRDYLLKGDIDDLVIGGYFKNARANKKYEERLSHKE